MSGWIKTFLIENYVWIEAFHVISVICWFAMLFYMPRLFVYHAMSDDDISNERFKVMERKLYRGIGTPSMVASLLFGLLLFASFPQYLLGTGWFKVKLGLVVLLVIYHFMCQRFMVLFRDDNNPHSHVFYRWFNEVPVIMLLGIVIMVIVKPF